MVKRDIFPATITGPAPYSLRTSIQYLVINGHKISTVINSGISESFIDPDVVRKLSITITKYTEVVVNRYFWRTF